MAHTRNNRKRPESKKERKLFLIFFFCILFSPFEKHHKGVELSAVFFVWGGIYFGAVWETVWN
jgi:uncharacterized membrane protein